MDRLYKCAIQKQKYSGFTIVELLVVIVVIGILATLTFVSFQGVSQRATTVTLQSDLENASKQLGIDYTNNGAFPATEALANGGLGLTKSPGTTFKYVKEDNNSYCISATSTTAAGVSSYFVSSTTGTVQSGACQINWSQIASGAQHVCTNATGGYVYCWGRNNYGQLGINSTTNSMIYQQILSTGALSGKTVTSIAASDSDACAIASDGLPYCWGYNNRGQLGDNSTTQSLVPVAVVNTGVLNAKTVRSIAAGYSHTCVIASDNLPYCWGYNNRGQLGNNSTTQSNVPVAVVTTGALAGKTVLSISTGFEHTCVVASDNQVYCWGSDAMGQLGNNSTTQSNVPVAVDTTGVFSGKTIKAVSSNGGYHNCAIASDDLAYCWGLNAAGQLGNNSTTQSLVPVAVNTAGLLSGKTIKTIATNVNFTCAIASDDKSYCWGNNDYGQFGSGNNTGSLLPVATNMNGVLLGKTLLSLTIGRYSSCAIASDKKAYCWGQNTYGQLGNNSTTQSYNPVAVFQPPQ